MFNNLSTKIKVKSSEFIRKHSSGLIKAIFVFVVAVICFIPFYIGLLFWWLISPLGFRQIIATLALLLIVFGSIQIVVVIFSIILIIKVLAEDL